MYSAKCVQALCDEFINNSEVGCYCYLIVIFSKTYSIQKCGWLLVGYYSVLV